MNKKEKNNVMIESIDIRLTKCIWTRFRLFDIDVTKVRKPKKIAKIMTKIFYPKNSSKRRIYFTKIKISRKKKFL